MRNRRIVKLAAAVVLSASAGVMGGNVTIDATLRTGFDNLQLPGPNYQLSESFGKLSADQQNLLISLRSFDIDAGETARFASQLPLRNIITRVTGGRASTINGVVISDVPGASLYLINPSGLVIGPTARFEVPGALHLSTADYLDFADGARLDTRGGEVPVLSSADPSAFGFLGPVNPVSITGATLRRPLDSTERSSISVTGGDLTLRGASLEALSAGYVELHAGRSAGTVTVPAIGVSTATSFTMRGNVVLEPDGSANASLDARNGGSIAITGGAITFRTAEVDISTANVAGGAISVRGDVVRLTDATRVRADAQAAGRAGAIVLGAKDSMVIENGADVASSLRAGSTGGGRSIQIDAQNLTIRTLGFVQGETATTADAPSIVLNVPGTLLIDGEAPNETITGLQTQTTLATRGAGRGGDIIINAGQFTMLREAEVFARTIGAGNAGNVIVNANTFIIDAQDLGYTGLQSRAGIASTGGSGGKIEVNVAGDLTIRKGGSISATTFGDGAGGEVIVAARNVYATEVGLGNIDTITGEPFNGIFSRSAKTNGTMDGEGTEFTDGGPAGAVSVFARDRIVVSGGSKISAESKSTESGAGQVTIQAPNVILDGGNVAVLSENTNGGNLRISADTLIVTNGSLISGFAAQDGGFVFLDPARVVVLGNGSTINAQSEGLPVETVIDPAATFIKSPDSEILADNPILPPELDITGAIVSFNISFTDVAHQLQNDCLRWSLESVSTFTIEPRGGIRQ